MTYFKTVHGNGNQAYIFVSEVKIENENDENENNFHEKYAYQHFVPGFEKSFFLEIFF